MNDCFTSGPVCKLFKRADVLNVKFDSNLTIGEDTVFNLTILDRINCLGIIPEIWYFYRFNENSATVLYNPKIVEKTESLFNVLLDMYQDNDSMVPYLIVRAAQQFHGLLILYPLHTNSKMSLKEKSRFIRDSLNNSPWKKIFSYNELGKYPASIFDTLLIRLCYRRNAIGIFALIEARKILKMLLQ